MTKKYFGDVKEIKLISDRSTDEVFVAVTVDLLPEQFHEIQSQPGVDRSAGKDPLKHLIENLGLRAKLSTLSLVTGYLFTAVALIIASPFNGLLAEKAEELVTGQEVHGPEGLGQALLMVPRGIIRELAKLIYYLPMAAFVLLLPMLLIGDLGPRGRTCRSG